jgi:hypothetical protein
MPCESKAAAARRRVLSARPVERGQIPGKFIGGKEARMSRFVSRGYEGSRPSINPKSYRKHLVLVAKGSGKSKA